MSDWLCEKHKLSVIENPVKHGKHYAEVQAEKRGMKSVRTTIREEIDMAINASLTFQEFCDVMKSRGYEFKFYQKNGEELAYPGLKPPGAHEFFRFHKLGANYELYAIKSRIRKNLSRQVPFPEAERETVRYKREHQPEYLFGKSSLHKLYIRYCFELHIIKEHPASVKRVPFSMREDLMYLDKLDAETQLLGKHKISTMEELRTYQQSLREQKEMLIWQRRELRNAERRCKRGGALIEAEAANKQIKQITKQLRELSKEASLCDDIAIRSVRKREELEALLSQQETPERAPRQEEPSSRYRSGKGKEV